MTGPARQVLEFLSHHKSGDANEGSVSRGPQSHRAALATLGPNIRVNHPAGDGIGDPDMTTQSEATLAVSGSNIVVGYNDDGKSSVFYKAADDLTGYSWSHDGGATWQDSALPNPYPGVNAGDPVVATDPAGHFYFATLEVDAAKRGLAVAVARSDDGGATFHTPKPVSHTGITSTARTFKEIDADKPWLTVGADPNQPTHSIIYASWTEFFDIFSARTGERIGTRIVVSSSSDLGQTWTKPKTVVSEPFFDTKKHRGQFVSGSNLAAGRGGRLYVAWERYVDPRNTGTFPVRQERVAHSGDAGQSFSASRLAGSPRPVGRITAPLSCSNTLWFGPGRLVRVQEFPVLGIGPGGDVYLAYNAENGLGHSYIRVAHSRDRGRTWTRKTVSRRGAFMPAMGADATGVDILYYQRVGRSQLKVSMARSSDGFSYSKTDVSSTTFGVPFTLPPFDPSIATCYMGDYNGVYRTGSVVYAAWGDNRDSVVNAFWPSGRLDPNVFFAKG